MKCDCSSSVISLNHVLFDSTHDLSINKADVIWYLLELQHYKQQHGQVQFFAKQ